ncbi:MAG: FAD-dependent oxidoreductase [Clostridia bacterium]|nr:FAD-dependent oxidoreductase [Clostridia bacterium]
METVGLKTELLKCDLCVVGGGIAGISAAITAARSGIKVVLIHERPVFGGNASGEIRMWICGVKNYEYRETGLNEEINLENFYYNPTKNYNLWNALLYNKVKSEKNIISLLNCTCFDAETVDNKIKSVRAYQMTTQKFFSVEAKYYADCSGDSILAPLTGAEFMYGREGKDEFNEPMQSHSDSDKKTMGNSCLLQARKTDRPVKFIAPEWAEKVSVEKLKSKGLNLFSTSENFWYIELGGLFDVIGEAENINYKLIALCLGVWDTIKNSGEFDADYFDLDFLGFLGAKRESRRMLGDYVLTANDVLSAKIFDDTVAYGGWPLDDHDPAGFYAENSNYTIAVKKPYGIPYRCLYSKNIDNLFFAGRNISATHMATSSARVMGTCGIIGQAVGIAASVAAKYNCSPKCVGDHIEEVQQLLLINDCFLPDIKRSVSDLCLSARLIGGNDSLRNGEDRSFGSQEVFSVENGKEIKYVLSSSAMVSGVKIVFDSDLTRSTYDMDFIEKIYSMRCNILDDSPVMHMPATLAKTFELTIVGENGKIKNILFKENKKRNILFPLGVAVKEISLKIIDNWGDTNKTNIFTFELY